MYNIIEWVNMMKNIRLERRLARIESILNRKYESNNDNVIQKVGDNWKILKRTADNIGMLNIKQRIVLKLHCGHIMK